MRVKARLERASSSSGTILGVILVAAAIWMCFKRYRNKKMMKQDINVNYDRAGVDYEYDTTGQDYD